MADAELEIYKLAVEMADRVSARRATANSFFLTIQTALVALLGVKEISDDSIAGAGLLLAVAWWLLLRSYHNLNRAKFEVIADLEKKLPVQVFGPEWEKLKSARGLRARYAELGHVEQVVPAVFAAVYVVALV